MLTKTKNMFSSDDARRELVPISPDRWPAAVGTELAEVSVFLTVQGSKTVPHQVWGPQTSWPPAGGAKTRAQTEPFDKFRVAPRKMHHRV